jgi:hypothetical protein
MNLLNSDGDNLKDFLTGFNLRNFVDKPTRIQTNFYEKSNKSLHHGLY